MNSKHISIRLASCIIGLCLHSCTSLPSQDTVVNVVHVSSATESSVSSVAVLEKLLSLQLPNEWFSKHIHGFVWFSNSAIIKNQNAEIRNADNGVFYVELLHTTVCSYSFAQKQIQGASDPDVVQHPLIVALGDDSVGYEWSS